jgi:hypothetical protein
MTLTRALSRVPGPFTVMRGGATVEGTFPLHTTPSEDSTMKARPINIATLIIASLALVVAAIGPAAAAHLITGKDIKNGSVTGVDIKNNSLTGKQIKESTLGAVPKANNVGVLPSGKSESGTFAGGGGNSTSGYYGYGITFPVPLGVGFNAITVVDTRQDGISGNCPRPGEAAKGYLCLYSNLYASVGTEGMYKAYGTNTLDPAPLSGIGIYVEIGATGSFVNGTWTVTSP